MVKPVAGEKRTNDSRDENDLDESPDGLTEPPEEKRARSEAIPRPMIKIPDSKEDDTDITAELAEYGSEFFIKEIYDALSVRNYEQALTILTYMAVVSEGKDENFFTTDDHNYLIHALIFLHEQEPEDAETRKKITEIIARIFDRIDIGPYNQADMLDIALREKSIKTFMALVDQNFDVNAASVDGYNALTNALEGGDEAIARYMISTKKVSGINGALADFTLYLCDSKVMAMEDLIMAGDDILNEKGIPTNFVEIFHKMNTSGSLSGAFVKYATGSLETQSHAAEICKLLNQNYGIDLSHEMEKIEKAAAPARVVAVAGITKVATGGASKELGE